MLLIWSLRYSSHVFLYIVRLSFWVTLQQWRQCSLILSRGLTQWLQQSQQRRCAEHLYAIFSQCRREY